MKKPAADAKAASNELKDFYKIIPKNMKTTYYNPAFDQHGLRVPFRCCVIGASGAGKSTLVLETIRRMPDTFGCITICCRDPDEPLYKFLKSKIPGEQLQFFEGPENIPPMDSLKKDVQHLIVFDDMVTEKEKDQKIILDYFKRARKVAKGCSLMYLTQSFFKTNKFIRINSNLLFIKKLASSSDLNLILRDCAVGVDKKKLLALYKYATDDKRSFLLVDLDAPEEARFRKNFLQVLPTISTL